VCACFSFSFINSGKAKDRENYAKLVQELREEFDRENQKTGRPRLLLTMAVPAGLEYIDKGYDVPKLNKYLDWFNLLSYDYHSAYEPAVNHHAPLYPIEEENEYSFDVDLNIVSSLTFLSFLANIQANLDKSTFRMQQSATTSRAVPIAINWFSVSRLMAARIRCSIRNRTKLELPLTVPVSREMRHERRVTWPITR
jgi:hypothetical protein